VSWSPFTQRTEDEPFGPLQDSNTSQLYAPSMFLWDQDEAFNLPGWSSLSRKRHSEEFLALCVAIEYGDTCGCDSEEVGRCREKEREKMHGFE
jgi:hypothetical protein